MGRQLSDRHLERIMPRRAGLSDHEVRRAVSDKLAGWGRLVGLVYMVGAGVVFVIGSLRLWGAATPIGKVVAGVILGISLVTFWLGRRVSRDVTRIRQFRQVLRAEGIKDLDALADRVLAIYRRREAEGTLEAPGRAGGS